MTKNQCTRLKTTLIYYPERNRKVQYMIQYICAIYVHNKGEGLCQHNGLHNGLIIQHADSVDGQTLQQCVQNVEKPPCLGLPPCPRNSYGHWDSNQGAGTPAKGIHPSHTCMVQGSSQFTDPRSDTSRYCSLGQSWDRHVHFAIGLTPHYEHYVNLSLYAVNDTEEPWLPIANYTESQNSAVNTGSSSWSPRPIINSGLLYINDRQSYDSAFKRYMSVLTSRCLRDEEL
jgi:hypothetical protein